MNALVVVLVTALLIVLSAFFVIIEFSLLGARRHRLEQQAGHSAAARSALRSMNELTIMLAGAQLGITAATFALGAVTKPAVDAALGPLLERIGIPTGVAGGASFVLSLLFVTFLHLVVGEMAPKSWAIAAPERAAKLVSPPARAYIVLVRPLLVGINKLANRLVRASGVEPVDRAAAGGQDADTIRHLVEHSAEAGALEQPVQQQISNVVELQHLTLADLVPAGQQVSAINGDATCADVQQLAMTSSHMRILIMDAAGHPDAVVHVRDTLLHDDGEPVRPLAREVLTLPGSLLVHEAFMRMRDAGDQLTVVMDNADCMVGVVGVSDILQRVLPKAGA